jgi:hypothetical protein
MRRIAFGEPDSELDAVIEAAQTEPVEIVQEGVGAAIGLSPAMFQSLIGKAPSPARPELERLIRKSVKGHDGVYRALATWEAKNEPPDRDNG